MADSSQKRGTQRVDVTLKVQLQYPDRDSFVERFSINVSRTGLFVRARDPAPVGSRVRFEYRLNDESRILRGTGVVRWVRSDASDPMQPPGMGIEFIDLDPASEQLVTHIVATKGEGERAPKRTAGIARKAPASSVTAKAEPLPELDQEEEDLLAGLAEGAAPKKQTPVAPVAPPVEAPTLADEIEVEVEERPAPDQPHTDQPTTEQPFTAKPRTEEPLTEQPFTAKPETEEPPAEQPTSEEPPTGKFAALAPPPDDRAATTDTRNPRPEIGDPGSGSDPRRPASM